MHEKILEILIYVLNEVRNSNRPIGDIDMKALESKGYTPSEISTALSWLFDRLNITRPDSYRSQENRLQSFRVLHPAEKFVISQEAFGHLIQLRQLNILSEHELEMVIERAMLSGFDQLNVTEIQGIVTGILFNSMDAMENSKGRFVFNANDTIQ